jgi:hypothetical protein
MKTLQSFAILLFAFGPISAFSHGEDKHGPHGGFVKMPGAFHTEVLKKSGTEFQIYLLDVEWKDPTIEGSSVSATLKRGSKTIPLQCAPLEDRFSCRTPKGESIQKKDQLEVTAIRKGASGGVAAYVIPLKLEKSAVDHSQH